MNAPLRFCMVTTFYPPYHFGGDAIYTHRLCQELAQRGHHVEVIHNADAYLALAGHQPDQTAKSDPNIIIHTLQSRSPLLSALAMQQTGTPALHSRRIRAILAQGFDVIHYHNVSLVGGPQVLEYGDALKLYSIHEYWLVCPTHVLFRFNREPCTRRSCFLCQLLYKRPPQLWRYTSRLRRAAMHVQAFLSGSHFAAEKHRQYGFDGTLLHLPYFVPRDPSSSDARAELAQAADAPSHRPYFLFVGRLEKVKGVHTLIPVFRNYHRAELWIAGLGNQEARLRRMASGSDNIHFLGSVSSSQLRAIYRNAVAVILPSLCFETFALVAHEALQQGTPVIVRNLGALQEIVQETGAGLTYHTNEELLFAMDRLISDRTWRDELGKRGHQAYLRKWTAETHLRQYLRLIEELASPAAMRGKRDDC